MFIFEKNIKNFDQVPNYVETPSFSILPVNSLGYLNLPFFKNWVVGFTNAEGSFLVKANKDACFQLKQAIHLNMFDSFKVLFDTSRKLSMENGKFLQFSVSSKKDIQTVINFFSFSGLHPLMGTKLTEYLRWLNNLSLTNPKIYVTEKAHISTVEYTADTPEIKQSFSVKPTPVFMRSAREKYYRSNKNLTNFHIYQPILGNVVERRLN